jgi:hypothetical protein
LNITCHPIKLIPPLKNEKGIMCWYPPERASTIRAARKNPSSKQKSSLLQNDFVSSQKESAAVHHVLFSFGDESELGDEDHAVVEDVEIISVFGSDTAIAGQDENSRTVAEFHPNVYRQSSCLLNDILDCWG